MNLNKVVGFMSFCMKIIEEINYAELKLFGTQV
jgi:hypothetical protein